MPAATVFNLNATALAQLGGSPGAEGSAPTFAAALALATDIGSPAVQQINGVNSTSATCAVTAGASPIGKVLILICKADATGTVTYTFSTGFKPTGTAAPTASKTIVVAFVGDGTNFFEFARSASAITG